MKKSLKNPRGITLVALVITIVILLILAAISIQALTNQGLFGKANDAKRESEIASIKEQIALDIYEKQLEPPVGSITDEQLETILGKYGTVNKEDGTIVGITTGKGYEILLKDIYGGETVAESVPDGAIVNPVNDITTWLKTGEISNQYSYTTIEQVIADSTCIESLMNNENAMKYLARSTEFANAICASETAITYLGQSAYVDDTVLNSDLWISKISSSSYWDLIYPSVTVHSSASATITVSGKSFTSDASGNTQHSMPWGTFSISDSVSGQSFECTICRDTTDVYVMPKGALYWYGNTNGKLPTFENGAKQKDIHSISVYHNGTQSHLASAKIGIPSEHVGIKISSLHAITYNYTYYDYNGVAGNVGIKDSKGNTKAWLQPNAKISLNESAYCKMNSLNHVYKEVGSMVFAQDDYLEIITEATDINYDVYAVWYE